MVLQLCCRLANKYEIMAAKEQHCRPKKITFSAPQKGSLRRSPPHCEMQCHRPCAKFQSNPFRNFGGDASQPDRLTHTNSKLNIPHLGRLKLRKRDKHQIAFTKIERQRFLTPDATHKRDLCWHAVSVRPSVCLSVSHVRVLCQNEQSYPQNFSFIIILVFPDQTVW